MTRFAVWAPNASAVEVEAAGECQAMEPGEGVGWWRLDLPHVGAGADYGFRLDGGDLRPDPRTMWQPHGVHGTSRVVDHSTFAWSDSNWRGSALPGSVLYELNVATFTPEGTFDAAARRLGHLVDLGVDTVEVMPVAAFPGTHGWGYDGVHLFAVHDPYGGPVGFKRFIDACHARGLGVVLDVVYNHLGPSGNYLGEFGPYFSDKHHTPWGSGINLDDQGSEEVRRFIVDNARMWLRDYHIDGLRLDAVHALADDHATNILEELARDVDVLAHEVHRPLHLVAESDLNDPRLVTAREAGGYGLAGQWDDDVHHTLHALLTGERQGYYCDFGTLPGLAKVWCGAYLHDGTWSTFRGRPHGRAVSTDVLPGSRFVASLQNHDQVGNRALGDRLSATLSPGRLAAGAALLLTSPFTPMLFMGEEWGASTPWQYFTEHEEPELAEAVRVGRRREFAEHGWDAETIPDPQDPETVRASVLDWSEPQQAGHARLLTWYRDLIALRRREPGASDPRLDRVAVDLPQTGEGWLVVRRGDLRVVVVLDVSGAEVPLDAPATEVVLAWDDDAALGERAVRLGREGVAVVRVTPPTAPPVL